MPINLLEGNQIDANQIITYVILALVVVLFIVWFIFSGRKNKQRQKEYVEQLDAIRPGHKVKTAGGICGIVVEVCDDNTVIIETGSEQSGKSYVKMDKELIDRCKGPDADRARGSRVAQEGRKGSKEYRPRSRSTQGGSSRRGRACGRRDG